MLDLDYWAILPRALMSFLTQYRKAVASGALKPDPAQEQRGRKLQALTRALRSIPAGTDACSGGRRKAPRGLYIWGDVGRGKSMLMDLFFEAAPARTKRRIHFNAFMVETHARIHAERESGRHADPIAPVAQADRRAKRCCCASTNSR